MKIQPSPGYSKIEAEFEAAIRRAFSQEPPPDFIFYDSRRQQFLIEAIGYGMEQGWLTGHLNEIDEQYARYEARLTDAGRQHLGLDVPARPA